MARPNPASDRTLPGSRTETRAGPETHRRLHTSSAESLPGAPGCSGQARPSTPDVTCPLDADPQSVRMGCPTSSQAGTQGRAAVRALVVGPGCSKSARSPTAARRPPRSRTRWRRSSPPRRRRSTSPSTTCGSTATREQIVARRAAGAPPPAASRSGSSSTSTTRARSRCRRRPSRTPGGRRRSSASRRVRSQASPT